MCCSSVIGWPRKRSTRLASQAARIAARSAMLKGSRMSTPKMSAPSPAANGLTVMVIALFRRLERLDPIVIDRDAPMDAIFLGRVVAGRPMIRAAIVPDHDVALAPDMMVFGVGHDHALFQLGDQRVAFLISDADQVADLAGIEVERLAARLRVSANNRVEHRL